MGIDSTELIRSLNEWIGERHCVNKHDFFRTIVAKLPPDLTNDEAIEEIWRGIQQLPTC
ncbi:MAG: hypothetical protein ACREL5_12145 [Gemmatimonadales bacterium]